MTSVVLTYDATDEVDALMMTLSYCEELAIETREGSFRLVLEKEDGEIIENPHTAFLYASRLAHTLPSNALQFARVHAWIEEERAMLQDWDHAKRAHFSGAAMARVVLPVLHRLEADLSETQARWLGGFEVSTAADFCWIARLKLLRDCTPNVLQRLPKLRAYATRDPSKDYRDEDSDASSEDEADDEADGGGA